MTDKCAVEGCQISETGVCVLHNVEVERREGMRELVDKIPDLMTTINRLVGLSSIFLFVVAGSYTYTYISKVELEKEITLGLKDRSQQIESMLASINRLAVIVGRNENQSKNTMDRLDRLSATLERYIEVQRRDQIELYKRSGDSPPKH